MTTSGTVAEWSAGNISDDRVLGWVAIYWDGQGNATQGPDIYSSVLTPWTFIIHTPDPEDLPLVDLQIYLLFYRRNGSMFTAWLDGWDDFWLWGKTEMVTGTLLPTNKWDQIQSRVTQEVWDHRGQFKQGIVDWINSVPG